MSRAEVGTRAARSAGDEPFLRYGAKIGRLIFGDSRDMADRGARALEMILKATGKETAAKWGVGEREGGDGS